MRRLSAYFAVLAWMCVIFIASTRVGSSENTGRIIGPLLRWFKPDVSEGTIKAVQAVVRKSGHLTEYAILAMLVYWARRGFGSPNRLSRQEFILIVGFCALYACTDEFHQRFVSSRQASPIDVLIDTTGAAIGVLLVRGLEVRRLRSAGPGDAPPGASLVSS